MVAAGILQREAARSVQAELDEIELRGILSGFKLQAESHQGAVIILCWWEAESLETGGRQRFRTAAHVRDESPEGIQKVVYDLLRSTLVHELGELMLVRGKQPYYPHDPSDPKTSDPFLLDR